MEKIREAFLSALEGFDITVDITPETEFRKIDGWDSLASLLLIESIHEKTGLLMSASDLKSAILVRDIQELVNRKTTS